MIFQKITDLRKTTVLSASRIVIISHQLFMKRSKLIKRLDANPVRIEKKSIISLVFIKRKRLENV